MPREEDYGFGKEAVRKGFLTQAQLEECLEVLCALEHVGTGKHVWDVAVDKGLMNEEQVDKVGKAPREKEEMKQPSPAEQEEGDFLLVHLVSAGEPKPIPVPEHPVTLGTDESCDIVLTEKNVVAKHARISRSGDEIKILDLRSEAGVVVNGQRVEAGSLYPGDLIKLGEAVLLLLREPPEGSSREEPTTEDRDYKGPSAKLECIKGPRTGMTFFVGKRAVVIGRNRLADIRVEETSVAEFHAHIYFAEGALTATDLATSTGTFVNDTGVRESELADGSTLQIGPAKFRVRIVGAREPAAVKPQEKPKSDSEESWSIELDAELEGGGEALLLEEVSDTEAEETSEYEPVQVIPLRYQPGEVQLTCIEGPDKGKAYPLEARTTLIGRMANADVRIDDATISRNHAEITFTDKGLEIRDLDSKNGVVVSGHRIKQTNVKVGDAIRLGGCVFLVDLTTKKK